MLTSEEVAHLVARMSMAERADHLRSRGWRREGRDPTQWVDPDGTRWHRDSAILHALALDALPVVESADDSKITEISTTERVDVDNGWPRCAADLGLTRLELLAIFSQSSPARR